jgi:hypothetical protein
VRGIRPCLSVRYQRGHSGPTRVLAAQPPHLLTDNSFGLRLARSDHARSYGPRVSVNDIASNSSRAIGVQRYTFPTELSVLGRGNYWRRTCSDSDGFRNSTEPDVQGGTDSPVSFITDSQSFGQAVAATPDTRVPLPARSARRQARYCLHAVDYDAWITLWDAYSPREPCGPSTDEPPITTTRRAGPAKAGPPAHAGDRVAGRPVVGASPSGSGP